MFQRCFGKSKKKNLYETEPYSINHYYEERQSLMREYTIQERISNMTQKWKIEPYQALELINTVERQQS